MGHTVTTVTPFPHDDDDHFCVPGRAIKRGESQRTEGVRKRTTWLNSIKGAARTLLYWPDPDIRWARRVVKVIRQADIKADILLTTSPPESIHVAGAKLSKALNLTWVAEMRDTWLLNSHREILNRSKTRALGERYIAKSTLSKVSGIIAVSDVLMDEAREFIKNDTPNLVLSHFTIPPEDNYVQQILPTDEINLVHTGSFSLSDHRRTLAPLLKILEQCPPLEFPVRFHILGELTDEEKQLAEASPVHVSFHGLKSLEETRGFQLAADALILYTPEDSHSLPGKYAEYAATSRPIYVVGNGSWTSLVEGSEPIPKLKDNMSSLTTNPQRMNYAYLTADEAAHTVSAFLHEVLERNDVVL